MDYAALAAEMLSKTGAMMKTNVPKQMNMLLHGEMFILHFISHKGDDVLPSELSVAMEASTARVAMTRAARSCMRFRYHSPRPDAQAAISSTHAAQVVSDRRER